jgi:hypothetical protein
MKPAIPAPADDPLDALIDLVSHTASSTAQSGEAGVLFPHDNGATSKNVEA